MKVAVLGPGGVGGLLAAALVRGGSDVVVVARESTAAVIEQQGVRVSSVRFGEMVERPRAVAELYEPVDALVVATKASGLVAALARVHTPPAAVLPLLNGLDHLAPLRARFGPEPVLAGTIRVEADRPEPGVIVHTSPFLLVSMASRYESAGAAIDSIEAELGRADVPVRVHRPISPRAEAEVMWSKLVRLNALACTTSAYDTLLGEIRSTPALRADLIGAIEEACAAANADGALEADPAKALDELERAHATLGSSMQRDIAAGREPELDAIPGSVLRAAARHGIACPTIERLVEMIAARAGVGAPVVPGGA
ncbi:MAG TPA: 2-dehydropantoate 2-reductase [Solirubrobacteraceae bacterium]|nr:2-dehydropantoate 2-reductase [Solirubrobacteraceae bacterium]